ncbi:chemotaxis protein CheB [Thiosocius teredinicola]|uniref:chemotaxis protein CheB n=1 Tax=Thiosocius teredinicola TaxID=1973002 RepID=UPI00099149A1
MTHVDRFPIVGIGASAGGLEALGDMLCQASDADPMAYVIVQHLDPNHQSLMAELLGRKTHVPVKQVDSGEPVEPGCVYVIPPGKNLGIENDRLVLRDFAQPRGLRRPIDDFFVSLAEHHGADAACVILSGTGADGTIGLRSIKEHGGVGLVQAPETAGYDGMPSSAVATGLVDFICDAPDIISTLKRYFERRDDPDGTGQATSVAGCIGELCKSLSATTGHDFAGYKKTTVSRRIERRMQILNIGDAGEYVERVRSDANEVDLLFRDLLINVTRFFRDPEYFDVLDQTVIRPLVEEADDEVRIWVPGCSSGEEAYSIAMLVANALDSLSCDAKVHIFATDIDSAMLAVAREGRYPPASFADIPEKMRSRYTIGDSTGFRIVPRIRDMIRFSEHSLVKDAPFSRIDLISCRNLLIYFETKLQQVVLPLFHYALNAGGYLFLGSSESVGRFDDLFDPLDRRARIFTRRDGNTKYLTYLPLNSTASRHRSSRMPAGTKAASPAAWEESIATRRVLDSYAPASMVVGADGEILVTNGQLGKFFEFRAGRFASQLAPALARAGLREVLSPLLQQASQSRKRMIARDVEVRAEFGVQQVDVVVDPLPDDTMLLIFKSVAPFKAFSQDDFIDFQPGGSQVELLEDELRLTRYRLRGTVEELETANEELKSSNEEMMSMNEELQSTNEELSTVNDELKDKVDQLTVANADLRNFFEATQMAVVVLDRDLRIRSFTDSALSVFSITPADKGRRITHVSSVLSDVDYLKDIKKVVAGGDIAVRNVSTSDGSKTWVMRIAPYRTSDGCVEGATMTLNDVTADLAIQSELDTQSRRLQLALSVAGIGVWEYLVESGETKLDENERLLLGVGPTESIDVDAIIARIHPEDRPAVESSLRRAISGETDYQAMFRVKGLSGELRYLRGLGSLVEGEVPKRLVGVNFDVTAEQLLKQARETMLSELNHRVKNLFAVINGLVAIASQHTDSVDELVSDVRERIGALGRAHSLTQVTEDNGPVFLKSLVETSLSPYLGHHTITLRGDDVLIGYQQITSLALIFHEWATNATKHGALRNGSGQLDVDWRLNEEDSFRLRWTESVPPKNGSSVRKTGFGSKLIELSVQQLRGSLDIETTGSRRQMELTVPLGSQ